MLTKRFWSLAIPDRRSVSRRVVDFYAVEISHGGRYLRRISNVSRTGLLLEDRLNAHPLGAVLDLELPRRDAQPVQVRAEIVRVTDEGQLGLRALNGQRLYGLGGHVDL